MDITPPHHASAAVIERAYGHARREAGWWPAGRQERNAGVRSLNRRPAGDLVS